MKLLHKGLIITVIPLLYLLTFVGLLGVELLNLESSLERVSCSKELVSQSLELVRTILSDYSKMNMNSEVEGLYDPETTYKSCADLRLKAKNISELAAIYPSQNANVAKLNNTIQAMTKILGWALYEQRQGKAHWAHVDEQCYQSVYLKLIDILDISSAIVADERERASYSQELLVNRRKLGMLLAVAVPGGILFSMLLGLLYARSISGPIQRIRQNSRLLSLQRPLLPELAGTDELATLDRRLHTVAQSVYELLDKERTLIADASEIICSLDREGIFRRVNASAGRLLGVSEEQLVGSSVFDWILTSDRLLADEKLRSAASITDACRFELRLLPKGGRLLESRWSVLWSPSEELFFCVVSDITEEKNIQKLKQDFLDMIGRDLRAPLCEIQKDLTKISSGACGQLSTPVREEIEKSERTVQRLVKMVNNLLDFRRLEAGEIELDVTSFKVLPVAQEAVKLLETWSKSKSVSIKISDGGETVKGDRDKLLQVLLNLLSNAIKFSPSGSQVDLKISSVEGKVIVQVRDEGPGIPADALETIFQPFEQTAAGEQAGGSGLGLAICRMIVEAHQGTVGARNAEGKSGAIVWFSLPLIY